jgi:hypothetical protein
MTTTSSEWGDSRNDAWFEEWTPDRYPAICELTTEDLEMALQLDQLHRRPVQLRLIDDS